VALRRRLEGVDTVTISQSLQQAVVEFAAVRHTFSPAAFRDAVDDAGVEVLAFHIDACGVIEEFRNQRWLVAGPDRFVLDGGEGAPIGQPVCVSGELDDRTNPNRMKIGVVRPAQQ
jgi:hypothetical protein